MSELDPPKLRPNSEKKKRKKRRRRKKKKKKKKKFHQKLELPGSSTIIETKKLVNVVVVVRRYVCSVCGRTYIRMLHWWCIRSFRMHKY